MATETVLRSSGVYTTVLGALNQFQAFTNLPYSAMVNTTLNKKYTDATWVNHNYTKLWFESGAPVTTPCLQYFGIGTRGYKNIDLEQSAIPFPGDSRMMDLYSPIPFRCVPLDEEDTRITAAERAKYRMRVVANFNGITYVMYYLKLIEFGSAVEVIKRDADGTESAYSLDASWLNPNPPDLNEISGSIDTNVNRIVVRASGVCRVTHDELAEAVSVIHNGDSSFYRISEIGYYTGCDISLNEDRAMVDDDDSSAKYKEATYVQLAKGHNFRGSELSTAGSYITPKVTFESECCINGNLA